MFAKTSNRPLIVSVLYFRNWSYNQSLKCSYSILARTNKSEQKAINFLYFPTTFYNINLI